MDKNNFEEILTTNSRYYGVVENNMPNGPGTMSFNDGEIHKGRFVNGKLHGYGTQIGGKDKSGWTYTGDFVNGIKHGHGKESNGDGSHYKGAWENNLPHGQGEVSFDDGQKETGLYSQGKLIDGYITKPDGRIVKAKS